MIHKAEPITYAQFIGLAFGTVIPCHDGTEVIKPIHIVSGAAQATPQERLNVRVLYRQVSRGQPW